MLMVKIVNLSLLAKSRARLPQQACCWLVGVEDVGITRFYIFFWRRLLGCLGASD